VRCPDGGTRFFLFHRTAGQWSGTQRKWMGWERKRGKLAEFNRLLRGAQDTSFIAIDDARSGAERRALCHHARRRHAAAARAVRQLVGTAAHPLNTPRFDPQSGAVAEGYGITAAAGDAAAAFRAGELDLSAPVLRAVGVDLVRSGDL
jgi:cyclic beta-1,2-glucan synthetase